MTECYGAVVRIALFDEDVSLEASHFLYSEDADAAERTCGNIKYLAFRDIRAEIAVGIAL